MNTDCDIPVNVASESRGRCIPLPQNAEEVLGYIYAMITAWGEDHGLPSDAEYRDRLDAANPPTGNRGHPRGMSAKRLRLAETARRWRELGYPESTIAAGLMWEQEPPPSRMDVEPLKQQLDRLERDLRKLETKEGKEPLARPDRNADARREAAYASGDSAKAGRDAAGLRERIVRAGRWPDEDPACLRAEAKHLRLQVVAGEAHDVALQDSRHGTTERYRRRELADREDMRKAADRLDRWAESFEGAAKQAASESLRERRVDPGDTRRPGFNPFAVR